MCKDCGSVHYVYKSCGHSHCMLCQSIKREQWMDRLKQRLLKVPYIHSTFTVPHQLNGMFRKNPRELYGLLMKTCYKTIRQIGKTYGITMGMTAVLHTFGSDMKYHIHVHALITYGGIDKNNEWQYPPCKNKISSYRVLCATFKKLMVQGIECLASKNKLNYHLPIGEIINEVTQLRWVVHSTRPTMDTTIIRQYLARYINRTAISPSRLTYVKELNEVHLLYNEYKLQQAGQPAPKAIKVLSPLEAIHQIMQHVLPPYFNKSRHFGLHQYAKTERKTIAVKLTHQGNTIRTVFEILTHLLGLEPYRCKHCQSEHYYIIGVAADYDYIKPYLQNKAPPASPALHTNKTSTHPVQHLCP